VAAEKPPVCHDAPGYYLTSDGRWVHRRPPRPAVAKTHPGKRVKADPLVVLNFKRYIERLIAIEEKFAPSREAERQERIKLEGKSFPLNVVHDDE
jgi:hypothetical protein